MSIEFSDHETAGPPAMVAASETRRSFRTVTALGTIGAATVAALRANAKSLRAQADSLDTYATALESGVQPAMNDTLTLTQAVASAPVTKRTLRAKIKKGLLAARKIGRDYVIARVDLDALLALERRAPSAPKVTTPKSAAARRRDALRRAGMAAE